MGPVLGLGQGDFIFVYQISESLVSLENSMIITLDSPRFPSTLRNN